jgi:tetratricopeptide (TPR) repeat protein
MKDIAILFGYFRADNLNTIKKIFGFFILFLCINISVYSDDIRDFDRYAKQAVDYYNNQQYRLAAEMYDKALKCMVIFPPGITIADYNGFYQLNLSAIEGRMKSYFYAKLYDNAISDAATLIKADKTKYKVYVYQGFFYRGRVYQDKNEHNKAIADMTEAIKCDNTKNDAYLYRAMSYNEIKEYRNAIDDCNFILSREPGHERAKTLLAIIDMITYDYAIGIRNDGSLGENITISGVVYSNLTDEKTNVHIPVTFEHELRRT